MDLNRAEFKKWLESKEPTSAVGIQLKSESCPIANYLKEKTGESYTVMGNRYYDTAGLRDTPMHVSPPWAWEFIYEIDHLSIQHELSAKEALDILSKITE